MKTPRRRPRFERAPVRARLTPADVALVTHIARHRFIRSTQLLTLFPDRSPKKLIERLAVLYHSGYIDRPRAQIDYYLSRGSARMVYAPGQRIGEVVSDIAAVNWTAKNRNVTPGFLKHELLLTDIMVAIEVAARARRDIEVIDARDLRQRVPDLASWTITAPVSVGGRQVSLSIIPDAVFALRFRPSGRVAYFFVEADRRSMPVHRSDLSQSSFFKKVLVYHHAAQARTVRERFGFGNFRVLTVTSSGERIASMQREVTKVARAPTGRFLFIERDAIGTTDPLSTPWSSTAGQVRLDAAPRT